MTILERFDKPLGELDTERQGRISASMSKEGT